MLDEHTKECELCGGEVSYKFSSVVLDNIRANYYECQNCHMLRSDHLDGDACSLAHVYRIGNKLDLDTGAAWRQYCVVRRLEKLFRYGIIKPRVRRLKALDLGGGSGFTGSYLISRLGWDAYTYDPFSNPSYLPGRFLREWPSVQNKGPFDLIIATEVFEHFVRPRDEIKKITAILPSSTAYLYVTTKLYTPEVKDASWPYLARETGQHVCFYSRKSVKQIARLLGNFRAHQVGGDYEWLFENEYGSSSLARRMYIRFVTRLLCIGVKYRIYESIEMNNPVVSLGAWGSMKNGREV